MRLTAAVCVIFSFIIGLICGYAICAAGHVSSATTTAVPATSIMTATSAPMAEGQPSIEELQRRQEYLEQARKTRQAAADFVGDR